MTDSMSLNGICEFPSCSTSKCIKKPRKAETVKGEMKKQSQFGEWLYERKIVDDRYLWQYTEL
jgi:hypothetical protein